MPNSFIINTTYHYSDVRFNLFWLADIIAVYKRSERFYIVGIEIKEWDKRVHQKIAMEYLETYRHTCEYFYLAAKKFSRNTLELADIGLFDLTEMKVIKTPEYLYPDVELRANIMKRNWINSGRHNDLTRLIRLHSLKSLLHLKICGTRTQR